MLAFTRNDKQGLWLTITLFNFVQACFICNPNHQGVDFTGTLIEASFRTCFGSDPAPKVTRVYNCGSFFMLPQHIIIQFNAHHNPENAYYNVHFLGLFYGLVLHFF